MQLYIRDLILLAHILLGITWLGGILFVGWGVYPAANKLPYRQQQKFLLILMKHVHLLLTLAGAGVISTGTILGTIYGPLKSWEMVMSTEYGRLFLSAFAIASFSLLWGALVSYNSTMKMLTNQQLWDCATKGESYPLKRIMRQVTFISSIEVAGLCIVVWIMVLI